MDSREKLHSHWADLSARADAFRKAYRESKDTNADEMEFIRAMRGLGFNYNQIRIEIEENRPKR